MIRSMSTAVTGLRGHQQKLDVIGNNIANVNTVAFKKSQARFEDLLSQTIQGATAPLTRGGINPSQVGMGMRVSSIIDIHFQGSIMNTDRETDLAVEGEGYFVVSDGTREYYTRDGSFGRDSNGELVNANGLKVLGWRGDGMLQGSGELLPMYIPLGERMVARPSETLGFAGNLDARNFLAAQNEGQQIDLGGATGGTFTLSYDGETTASLAFNATAAQVRAALAALSNLGANDIAVTGAAGSWSIDFTGSLEEQDIPLMVIDGSLLSGATGPAVSTTVEGDTGVDEVQQINLDGASDGNFTLTFGANTTAPIAHNATAAQVQAALELLPSIGAGDVTVTGANGGPYEVTFTNGLAGTNVGEMTINNNALFGAGSQTVNTTIPGVTGIADVYTYEYYVYDSLGRRYAVDFTFTPTAQNTWAYDLAVSDPGGTPIVLTGGTSGVLAFDDSGAFDPFASNIPDITFTPEGADQLVVTPSFENTTQLAGGNTMLVREQDGYAAGELIAFYISRTGTIIGTYTNGMVEELGQIAMAFFSNPEGLIKEGGNLYMETANSGEVRIGLPGTEGRGLIQSSALEMSNTDLAYEFTELITTSRAFQANTRVVTTSDEVLVEVINMKR